MNWDALAAHFAGERGASADEARLWLEAHPEEARRLASIDEAVRGVTAGGPAIDVEAALRRFKARRAEDDRKVRGLEPRWRRRMLIGPGLIAAGVVGLVAVGLWTRQHGGHAGTNGAVSPGRVIATGTGQRDSVVLGDGTHVILGPASLLVVPQQYGARARELQLHGDAYFDVVHDASRPFTVHSGGAVVRDVGTSFGIQTNGEGAVTVVVTSGVVALADSSQEQQITLRAGDVGVAKPGQKVTRADRQAGADDVAWTTGKLVLRDASMTDVAASLRRWYGLELRVEDSALRGRHLTATFNGETAAQALRIISLALGADVVLRGDTVVVRSWNSSSHSSRPK